MFSVFKIKYLVVTFDMPGAQTKSPRSASIFLFENFLFLQKLHNCTFYTSSSMCSINFIHNNHLNYLFFFNLKTNLSDLYFVINRYNSVAIEGPQIITCFRSIGWNFTLNFIQNIKTNEVFSLSNIFSAFVWLERELKESTALEITGLIDSRRLLSDYGHQSNVTTTPYYNLALQVVV